LATGFSVVGVSFPTFFIGLLAIMVFIIWTGLLPFPQYRGITEDPAKWFTSLILPWFVLAIVSAATYVRMTRNGMLEVMNEEFVRLGIAKGLSRRRLIVKYVMRAALVPIVTIAGLDFAFLLGGALVTESIFNLPGLGKLTLAAVVNSDLPILVATTLVAAVFIVVANAVVDVLYGYLDPRVRVK
jgi:peptide/nickel transport system permease protein